MVMPTEPKSIHVLKVTLLNTKPPIWRRVEVASTATLADLHHVVQRAMGWYDCHLHEFEIDRVRYGIDDGEGWGDPPHDERRARLLDVAPEGAKFEYTYDFGDDWRHRIVVESVIPAASGVRYPRCTAGKRACPPEDVGGPWGFQGFLEAIGDPRHEEHTDFLEWVGGGFSPSRFDLAAANEALTG
jgi:hypothetical protein